MGVRFSMKWLLAGMVYVALAAAAFSQTHWAWADVLWLASFLAVCYAATVAFFARGERQGRAVGFFAGSFALLVAIQCAPDAVPIGRIVTAFGPAPTISFPPQIYPTAAGQLQIPSYQSYSSPSALQGTTFTASSPYSPLPAPILNPIVVQRTRAANAVAAMLAGIAGSVLGVLAYRRSCAPHAPA